MTLTTKHTSTILMALAFTLATTGCFDYEESDPGTNNPVDTDVDTDNSEISDTETTAATTCADNPCDANATCDDMSGEPVCTCNEGYEGDGTVCADIDECATEQDDCHLNADCTDLEGSYECACKQGFEGDGTTTCTEMSDCDVTQYGCHANAFCTFVDHTPTCQCQSGYEGNGVACTNIDDCTPDPCVHGSCTDQVNAYECSCDSGWIGETCNDLECLPNDHLGCSGNAIHHYDSCDNIGAQQTQCDPNADCIVDGSDPSCECKTGFSGNGLTCTNDASQGVWQDPNTSLFWQNPPMNTKLDWSEIESFCAALSMEGFVDWRAPNLGELAGLIDTTGATAPFAEGGGPGTSGCYWNPELYGVCDSYHSNTYQEEAGSISEFLLDFKYTGYVEVTGSSASFESAAYVRCVSSGSDCVGNGDCISVETCECSDETCTYKNCSPQQCNQCAYYSAGTDSCSQLHPDAKTCTGVDGATHCLDGVCEKCTSDSDCAHKSTDSACDATTGECVPCTADGHCGSSAPYCISNACKECKADSDCVGHTHSWQVACNTANNRCVECTNDSHCSAFCWESTNYCGCNTSSDCPDPDAGWCDPDGNCDE